MSDIYLSITETPTVVTLTNPLISSNVAQSVTVTNVVSVNVVTMPAINVTAAAPSVTTVAGTVAVSNFPASQVVSVSNFPASSSVTIANFPSVTTVAGTVALDSASLIALENVTVTVGAAVSVSNFPSTQTIAGTVTANVFGKDNTGTPQQLKTDATGSLFVSASGSVQCIDEEGLIFGSDRNFPISGTVTVSNSVTIGSLPAISGTVTANSIFPRVTLIDGSGTVATANTAITVFASSSTRSYLLIQVTTGSAFVNVGATATTVNGINLTAGQGYSWETTIPQGVVSLISTTTSSRYVAKEA